MSEHTRMALATAEEIAEELVDQLRPFCERITVAGSIRRRCPDVGDIELVAIPRMARADTLLGKATGEPYSLLDGALEEYWHYWEIEPTKNGPRMKQFVDHRGAPVDLFVTTPEQWGANLTIRTGHRTFATWLVTPRSSGGAMPLGMRSQGARLWRNGSALETPEEADYLREIGVHWCEPPARCGPRPDLLVRRSKE